MTTKRVLHSPPPLPSITMSFTNTDHTTGTSDRNFTSFESYQLMEVGTSAKKIQVPMALPMSDKLYRKAMTADLFFRKIKALAVGSSFSSEDLVATIATYFDFHTGSVEIEAAKAVNIIRATVYQVKNLTGLGFRNQYGTPILCHLNKPCPANLTYFAFRSVLRAYSFAIRGPDLEFSFNFVLKLPQTFVNVEAHIVSNIVPPLSNQF